MFLPIPKFFKLVVVHVEHEFVEELSKFRFHDTAISAWIHLGDYLSYVRKPETTTNRNYCGLHAVIGKEISDEESRRVFLKRVPVRTRLS